MRLVGVQGGAKGRVSCRRLSVGIPWCQANPAAHRAPATHPTHPPTSPHPAAQDMAPREASVLFHMGKIYKRLDMLDEAMACFSSALDLQPPSADTNLIKSAGKGAHTGGVGGALMAGAAPTLAEHELHRTRGTCMQRRKRKPVCAWRAGMACPRPATPCFCPNPGHAVEKLRTPDENEEEEI